MHAFRGALAGGRAITDRGRHVRCDLHHNGDAAALLLRPTHMHPLDEAPRVSEAGVRHTRPRILIVDDEAEQRASLARALTEGDYIVEEAADAGEALRRSLREPPDLIVLDLRLPDATGVELAGAFRAVSATRRTPIVVVTAYTDIASRLDPKRFGAECVLTKPVSDDDLLAAVRRCFVQHLDDEEL